MSQPNQNHNGIDHKDTKIFVGGLAWRTTTDDLRGFFQEFGDVLDANVVLETYPAGRSKGYGFVTFRDAESAARALENPTPMIDGRQTNINLAYLRAKNNQSNQSSQNGLLHNAGSSHQYQNGSLNQAASHQYQLNPQYTNPHFPPVYWNQNHGQYCYMYNVPYYPYSHSPMIYQYHHHVATYGMLQNWHQTNIQQPVRISKPQRSSVRIEDINENNQEVVTADVERNNNNNEAVTEPEGDVFDQQLKAKDQEGDSIGQDNDDVKQDVEYQEGDITEHEDGIKQDAKDQEVGIMSGQDNDIKQDAEDQEIEILTGQDNDVEQDAMDQEVKIMRGQYNDIKQDAEDQEVKTMRGQDNGIKQEVEIISGKGIKHDARCTKRAQDCIEFTHQNERVLEEEAEDTPQENGVDHEESGEYTSQKNRIGQEAEGLGQECVS